MVYYLFVVFICIQYFSGFTDFSNSIKIVNNIYHREKMVCLITLSITSMYLLRIDKGYPGDAVH